MRIARFEKTRGHKGRFAAHPGRPLYAHRGADERVGRSGQVGQAALRRHLRCAAVEGGAGAKRWLTSAVGIP